MKKEIFIEKCENLVKDLKPLVLKYISKKLTIKESPGELEFSYSVKPPLTEHLEDFIFGYLNKNKKKYNIHSIEKPWVTFKTNSDFLYQAPINVSVSSSDIDYGGDVEFSVWLNTSAIYKIELDFRKEFKPGHEVEYLKNNCPNCNSRIVVIRKRLGRCVNPDCCREKTLFNYDETEKSGEIIGFNNGFPQ